MQETVKYILENNMPVAQVFREIGVNKNALHAWVKGHAKTNILREKFLKRRCITS
ncbi:hypothetical protein [Bacillus cereus]|uniref:hypothetical protein n=1 Tax=Bacillus cereus TaxID=1396 RepID=UPI00240687A2|nr:hypothetical protein [Bacillus cereus]